MHSLSAARGRHIDFPFSRRVIGAIAALSMCGCLAAPAPAQDAASKANPPARAEFREPVTLASKDGVLEVRLTARQGTARLDTVATPVKNFLVFDYQLIRGTPSDGQMSGGNLYPAPTLQVFPGETLIVHLENGLSGLTIRDYFSPQYTPKGETVPIYPEQLTSSPLNLHVHGVHVSPKGNADNVLLHIPAGMSNTYTYNIPNNMPQGAYWYHSHLHGLTAAQTYLGLAGLLSIGRTDGNLPLVTQNSIPVRNMLLQYNFVSNRENGLAQLNNPYWPQFVSTIKAPQGDELAKGTYRPLLTPVNFTQSKPGQKYFTTWWGGPLSIQNQRGRLQFIPSNLLRFTPQAGSADPVIPPNPSLPDSQRDVQFTVNGQFQPVIHSKAGQTEIWVLANVSDIAYINVQLTETATGRHPKIAIVGQDGNPYPAVHYPADRQRHAAARSAGKPVRHRRDNSGARRSGAGDTAARGRHEDDQHTGRALHQQRHGQPSGCARQPERAAVRHQLRRRVLRLPDAGVGTGGAFARSRPDDRVCRGTGARRLYVLRRAFRQDSRCQA